MRLTLLLVVTLLAVGCGSEIDRYCDTVAEHRQLFAELNADNLIDHLPELREVAGDAPEDLVDEWQVFIAAVTGLADAVAEHGRDSDAVADAATRLAEDDVVDAVGGIESQARDVCKIQLGL